MMDHVLHLLDQWVRLVLLALSEATESVARFRAAVCRVSRPSVAGFFLNTGLLILRISRDGPK